MIYISTRGKAPPSSFEDVLLQALAPDGGLYMPEQWAKVKRDSYVGKDYEEIVGDVLNLYAGDLAEKIDMKRLAADALASFDVSPPAPLTPLGDALHMLELFHGPTHAFKDFAMQILARLMELLLQDREEKTIILTATSGDTGAAAMHAFRESRQTQIVVLYPDGRIAPLQRRQMTTCPEPHLHAIAIKGDFDDCQKIVKTLFAQNLSKKAKERLPLSGVNSINWARIVAQIAYYLFAAERHPDADFSVPTGNFGDVFAGYAAKRMGAPIGRLVIATNENRSLVHLLETGIYAPQKVRATLSPSMDIQAPSNFERVLFDGFGRDPQKIRDFFDALQKEGEAHLSSSARGFLEEYFRAQSISEKEALQAIAELYKEKGVIIDPHSAVGLAAAKKHQRRGRDMIALATAHPAKFPEAVARAIGKEPAMPANLSKILEAPERIVKLPNAPEALMDYLSNLERAL